MNILRWTSRILIISIILTSIVIYSPAAHADIDYDDILLVGSERLTITKTAYCDNITLGDNATLIVEDTHLDINGIIRMSKNARFSIIDSRVELNPPALNDSTHVLHIVNDAMITVEEDSIVIFNPQPTATNISYMLLEDSSSFYLVNSSLTGNQPSVIHQSIELASVTAGVYLLSGYASWHVIGSSVNGELSPDGRWFWCSLHQRSTLTIEDTILQLSSSDVFLKPVSGLTTINNSIIIRGLIDCEVTAEIQVQDTIFHSPVVLKDQTNAKFSNCTFLNGVKTGSALSMGDVQQGQSPETVLEISGSVLKTDLNCEGNSSTRVKDSTIKTITLTKNASIEITNSSIQGLVTLNQNSQAVICHSMLNAAILNSITIYDQAFLHLEACQNISEITLYTPDRKGREIAVNLRDVQIPNLNIYSTTVSRIRFENAVCNISFYNDVNITFECFNTTFERLKPWRSGENVTFTFLLVNSTTPDLTALNKNITVNILHRLEVLVNLNDNGIEADVEVLDSFETMWKGRSTSGIISFDLPYQIINDGSVETTEDYTVKASYLGFSEEIDLALTSSKQVIFDWEDLKPPTVTNISINPGHWNLGKEITVSATITDEGVMSISSATLFYCIDNGNWVEVKMFRVGKNRYEAAIPKQGSICSITYYISTVDLAGNEADTNKKSLNIGREESLIFFSGIIILACLISAITFRRIIIHRKIKGYADKYKFRRNVR